MLWWLYMLAMTAMTAMLVECQWVYSVTDCSVVDCSSQDADISHVYLLLLKHLNAVILFK